MELSSSPTPLRLHGGMIPTRDSLRCVKVLPTTPTTTLKASSHFFLGGFSKHLTSTASAGHYHQGRRSCCNPLPKRPISIRACSTEVGAAGSGSSKVLDLTVASWRFLRPHTLRGTVICFVALGARALVENSSLIKWSFWFKAVSTLFALLCGNSYIVGINQIFDIDIDKVNKPYLQIAAGKISVRFAGLLVTFFAAAGLLTVGFTSGPLLFSLYTFVLFLGTIYSVPPLRMKRFPVAAFLSIVTGRVFLLNFGVYYAIRATLGLAFEWSPPMVFITTFMTLFAFVIAIAKDLPDVEGDRKYQISIFATKLGVRNIAFLGSGVLLMNYVVSILTAIYMPQAFKGWFMIPAHMALALSLIYQVKILEQANYNKEALSRFYQFIWCLLYVEYAIFPFI